MESKHLIQIYECLCDETRLRILSLLHDGPLCVSHLQEIMREPQVKISKHLAYLRGKNMVEVKRHRNMMIYHLPIVASPEIEANLACLRDCVKAIPSFMKDKENLYRLLAKNDWLTDVANSQGLRTSKFPHRAAKKKAKTKAIA